MGLRDTFSKAAQTAFTAAGDVPETVWYYSFAQGTSIYDVSSGTASTVQPATMTSMIFENYKTNEMYNEGIEPTDVKGMVPQAYISGIDPSPKDYIMRVESGASVRYDVMDIMQDPAGALWEFQLRKP